MELKPLSMTSGNTGVKYLGLDRKDFIFTNSFSIKRIKPNQIVYIPDDQQMVLKQSMVIEGELVLDGELSII